MQHRSRRQSSYHQMPSWTSYYKMEQGYFPIDRVDEGRKFRSALDSSDRRWTTGLETGYSIPQKFTSNKSTITNWLGHSPQWLAGIGMASPTRDVLVSMAQEKSSKCWTVELIKKLWNIAWDLWDQQNEALHNPQNPCDDIIDSRINDQLHSLFSNRLMAVPGILLGFSMAL